jgi:hypothetical protein
VQKRFVDVGFFGDLLHPRSGRASPDKHDVRGIEDALFGVTVPAGGRLSLWFNHTI